MDFQSMLNDLKRNAADVSSSAGGNTRATKRSRFVPTSETNKSSLTELRNRRRHFAHPTVPVRTVYLACPPDVQTGGPEAMHQLCDALNTVPGGRVRAKMLYLRESRRETDGGGLCVRHARGARRVDAYEDYVAPAAECMPGDEDYSQNYLHGTHSDDGEGEDTDVSFSSDLVIWPECWTHLIDAIPAGTKIVNGRREPFIHQTAIWWLSVDNNNGRFKTWDRDDVLHLHQSEYARQYLSKNGAKNVLPMTEYIPASTAKEAGLTITEKGRDLDVLYNPLKGMHYTDEIIRRSGRGRDPIEFAPIGGRDRKLAREEVASLLKRARVYVDFGPHPGMDRLPREAALAGCVVITNAEGAAGNEEDVPIPGEFKLRKFDAERVNRLLRNCLKHFEGETKKFEEYRSWIRAQRGKMDECVGRFLEEVVRKRSKEALAANLSVGF